MNNDNKSPSTYETKSKKSKNKSKKSKSKSKKTSGVDNSTPTKNTINSNNTNKKDNDPNKPKERKTINVSIQKRNFDKLNSILNSWDDEELNISREVCKCILFKHELENSPLTQSLVSTLDLVKTSLKNKQLFDNPYDKALFTALKNIISIKIDANELSNFIVDDFYFSKYSNTENSDKINVNENNSSIATENISHTNQVDIIKHSEAVITTVQDEPTNNSSGIIQWNNIPETPTVINGKNLDSNNSNKNNQQSSESSKISQIELLNKRLDAFSYPTN